MVLGRLAADCGTVLPVALPRLFLLLGMFVGLLVSLVLGLGISKIF